ncbi:MAG TPA: hypothetical protein VH253_13515 [Phycisphaerae bacterium]|nr:hypothetical protein [Phycisphaerae bacterium]
MTASSTPHLPRAAPPRARWLTGYPAALVVILLSFIVGLSATTHNSATSDEGPHIAGGYIHWTRGDPRVHTENGYLSQAIAALPLLVTHPRLPDPSSPEYRDPDPFLLGRDLLYESGNDAARMLLMARGAIGLLAAITALATYAWSRRLFGPFGGMLSLVAFAFSPVALAHGFVATSDMSVTCFALLTLAAFAWTMGALTPLRVVLSGVLLTATLLAKMSGPLVIPVLVLMVVARGWAKAPLPLRLLRRERLLGSRRSRLLAGTLALLAIAAIVWFLLWATYGFTYSAFKDVPEGYSFFPAAGWTFALKEPDLPIRIITFARAHKLLPEAFLYGYAYVDRSSRYHGVFANGAFYPQGVLWFYPYVFLITTPIAVLIFMGMAAIVARNRYAVLRANSAALRARLSAALPLLAFMIVYWAAALPNCRLASGPRHLLPAYPMLCIFLGVAAAAIARRRMLQILTGVLAIWLAAADFFIYPHYLSYFNEAVGGPSHGYECLIDSAVDWGQDLPALADYLAAHNPRHLPVYLSYLGCADPAYYGIRARPLPSYMPLAADSDPAQIKPLSPGLYCMSVTMIHRIQSTQNVTPEMERVLSIQQLVHLCAYLEHRRPTAQAGYSINIYELTAADLAAATRPSESSSE